MSYVYIVVATRGTAIENCEAYAGIQSALGRAFQLSSDNLVPDATNQTDIPFTSPAEEQMADGSVRWVFMDTDQRTVMINYRKIEEILPSVKDPASAAPAHPFVPYIQMEHEIWVNPSVTAPIHTQTPTAAADYDLNDPTLPVGWKIDNLPALMSDMTNNALNIKDPLDLTEEQKWALVTVRLRKSPNWKGVAKGSASPIAWHQKAALKQIEERTGIGELLRDKEIESLHEQRETLLVSQMFRD
jgi:hypothetical protein